MKLTKVVCLFLSLSILSPLAAWADSYHDTLKVFQDAGQSSEFFENSYGYAMFPSIAKAGFVIGGAGGKGRVYENGTYVGDTSMGQLSVGLQLGAQGFSQIIFFKDKAAFDKFTSGNFEFGVGVSAVVITAAASASAGTTGSTASASGGKNNALTEGDYIGGMAVFTVIKGGLMYETVLAGQKFEYTSLK